MIDDNARAGGRLGMLPGVAESGYPGFEAIACNGLFTAPVRGPKS